MNRPDDIRPKKWETAPLAPAALQYEFSHINPILLQVLYNRGLAKTAVMQSFLDGRYHLSRDPFLLPDMEKAAKRLVQAIQNDEKIVIYGDFDADGVTATIVLVEGIRGLGAIRNNVRPYIPDRIKEGYGLNKEALTTIKEEFGTDLVITVDCGIRSVAEVAHANEIGLDIIITDHHGLGDLLPDALAIVNPKRPLSKYPEIMLAGVGIAYKLIEAVQQTLPDPPNYNIETLLDLVAIGTVADLAPLLGENRDLVIRGLAVINKLERPGIAAIAKTASLQAGNITAESIGFGLGPRINAAGRIGHAYDAAKLLAAPDMRHADALALKLDALNKERQQLTRDMSELAERMVEPDDSIIIAGDSSFHPGVVGLVASRLADNFYRPAIAMEIGAEVSHASCRSIPNFHITDALDEAADLLVRHGGHAQAAGLTIRNENIPAFKKRMLAIADERLRGMERIPAIAIDCEIDLNDVDYALYETLCQLEPTGNANATPIFLSRDVEVVSHRAVGADGSHLQMKLISGRYQAHPTEAIASIAFRQAGWCEFLPARIDIVYSIGINEWRGQRNIQLQIQDINITE